MTVDVDRVRARLVAMRRLLAHLDTLGEITPERLETAFDVRLQVERVLSQVITLATEINAHVVARELGRPPGDLRSSFTDMVEAGWLDTDLAGALRSSTGLRNVLVHEYVEIDSRIVAEAVPLVRDGYGRYVREVAGRL